MALAAREGHASQTICGATQSEIHAVSRTMLSPGCREKPAASQCAMTALAVTSTTAALRFQVRKATMPPATGAAAVWSMANVLQEVVSLEPSCTIDIGICPSPSG